MQSANLRQGCSIVFGNDVAREKWERDVAAARSRQTVPYAVAPLAAVTLANGEALAAGQEVTLSLLVGQAQPAPQVMRQLIARGLVIAKDESEGPQAA